MVILGVLTIAAVEAVQLYGAVSDLRNGANELQASLTELGSAPGQWDAARIDMASHTQVGALKRLQKADRRLRADPLLRALGMLPYAKDQVNTGLDLSSTVTTAAKADADLIAVAGIYVSRPKSADGAPGPGAISLLEAESKPLSDADARLTAASAALDRDSHLQLLEPLRSQVSRGQAKLGPARELAHTGSELTRRLPSLLGAGETKTYLVLLANPSELRPSGGFTGEVGTVTFEHGNLTKLDLRNEYEVTAAYRDKFLPQGQEGTFLTFKNNQLDIGDAGWDPDFPTSARLQERMYTSATGQQLDGTISLDPLLISGLLKVTGPVDVAPYGTFDAANVFLRLNVLVNLAGTPAGDPRGGKDALPRIAAAILAKVFALPSSKWPELGTTFLDAAQQRHLQISVHDLGVEAVLHEYHFDGSLVSTPLTEDYLFIAEANVAGTKADYYIKRSVEVKVEIYPSGLNRHEVDIHYEYPPARDAVDATLNTYITNPTSLYRDYVRFYLPLTATLGNIGYLEDGKPAPGRGGGLREQGFEANRQVFGTFFVLPRGHTADLIIYYEVGLPADPPFELYVQKQAGLPDLPVQLTVSYPGGLVTRKSTIVKDETFAVDW